MSRWLALAAAAQKRDFQHTRSDITDKTRQNPLRGEQKGNAEEVLSGFVGFVVRGVGENRIFGPPLPAPAPDLVATILETFPQSTVVGEAERLEVMVRRLLDEGAGVEPSDGGGVRLSAEDGRAMLLTAVGLAGLPGWLRERLQDDAAEQAAIRAEGGRTPAWAEEADAPRPGERCRCCRGQRWWRPAIPRGGGTGLGLGWRCGTCHPPDHLSAAAVVTAP